MASSVVRASTRGQQLPVAVIGGGLGAFAAALSLHRAGVRNKLFIPDAKITQQARSAAFIGGPAVRILDRLGLGSDYRALGSSIHQLIVEDTKGKEIISFKLDGYGMQVWTVPRDYLLQLIVEALPSESVHFNHKFRSLRVNKTSTQIEFQPSFNDPASLIPPPMNTCDADFVIGADGLNSSVRSCTSRTSLTLPSGVLIWRAVVRHPNVKEIPLHVAKEIWHGDRRFGFVRITQEEVMWWAIAHNLTQVILRPFTPHLQRMFAGFPNPVQKLLSSVDSDRHIYRQEMKRVWPQRLPWFDESSFSVALVGDAGRTGTTENFHTGASFAIEDAYTLANLLVEHRDRDNSDMRYTLQKYDENRQQHLKIANKLSMQVGHLADSQFFVGRYFATRFLRRSVDRTTSQGMSSILHNLSDSY